MRTAAAIVDTFYQGKSVRLWACDEAHIQRILDLEGLRVEKRETKHYFSPLIYGLCRNLNWASMFHVFDPIARNIPWEKWACANVIYSRCQLEQPERSTSLTLRRKTLGVNGF